MSDGSSSPSLDLLLKETSRSFHLTLRVLPGRIRPQIGLAYLLARTSDTIADTGLVPLEQRLRALQLWRDRVLGLTRAPLDFGELARHQGAAAERRLLEHAEAILPRLGALTPSDLELVRAVLNTITSGQELDLRRFAGASKTQVAALRTDDELDDYTYRVAGCVGEFWTKICRAHLFPRAPLDESWLLANGVRFGKGLQLTNILRDLPADLRQGRCYLPAESLAHHGLRPEQLLDPQVLPRLRPLYDQLLDRAWSHLQAGWAYTNALPWRQVRVRLACAWPILIGFDTLALLRAANVLDPHARIKITRQDVRRVLWQSTWRYPVPALWRNLAPACTSPPS